MDEATKARNGGRAADREPEREPLLPPEVRLTLQCYRSFFRRLLSA
jgi:hypothetical protein